MTYLSKPHRIEAFLFEGTLDSALSAEAWVGDQDISDAEVTWQTNSSGSTALDVMTNFGMKTLEEGDFLYTLNGELYAEKQRTFLSLYEKED